MKSITEEEILQKLNLLIHHELEEIDEEIGSNRVFKLLELTKCIDHCFVTFSFVTPKKSKDYKVLSILYQKFTTGWYDLLNLIIAKETSINLSLKISSNKEQIIWANSVFTKAGNIGNLKRMIALKQTTDFIKCSIVKNKIKFEIYGKKNGAELVEAEQQRRMGQNIYNDNLDLLVPEQHLNLLLEGNVYSSDLSTIQYHKNDSVEEYYRAKGESYAKALLGFDSFSDESIFNGIHYKSYKKIVTCLISRCLKHLDLCFHYQKKTNYQLINPWDTYPQITTNEHLIDELALETKLDPEYVFSIIQVICLTRDKLDKMKFQPGYAPPSIIQFGSGSFLLSMMGNLSNPFVYLNKCLHHLFEKDRQIAVSSREDMFKRQLYDAFSDKIVKIQQSFKLRENGKDLTDIDAVIFDEENQTLFLIQIKWMDDWGTDMYQRSSMKRNYVEKVEKWITTIDKYIEKRGRKHLFESLNLNIWNNNTSIHYVILGKHFSHFSDYTLPINTLAVSWAGLLEILHVNPPFRSSLKMLAAYLDSNYFDKALRQIRSRIKPMNIELGGYKIKIESRMK